MAALKSISFFLLIAWVWASAENNSGFADALYQSDQFSGALLEYKRLEFFNPDAPKSWKYRTGICYRKLSRYEQAVITFRDLLNDSVYADSAALEIGACLIESNRPDQFHRILPNPKGPMSLLAKGLSSYFLEDYPSARMEWMAVSSQDSIIFDRAHEMIAVLDVQEEMQLKSRAAAGLLSVVPGMGHFYTKHTADGFVSIAAVGLTGLVSFYYYDLGAKGRASAFGAVAGIFYAGSIYGAVNSAKRYNGTRLAALQQKMKHLFWGLLN